MLLVTTTLCFNRIKFFSGNVTFYCIPDTNALSSVLCGCSLFLLYGNSKYVYSELLLFVRIFHYANNTCVLILTYCTFQFFLFRFYSRNLSNGYFYSTRFVTALCGSIICESVVPFHLKWIHLQHFFRGMLFLWYSWHYALFSFMWIFFIAIIWKFKNMYIQNYSFS